MEPNKADAFFKLIISLSVIYPTLLNPPITGSCHQSDKSALEPHTTYIFHVIYISVIITKIFIIFITALSSHLFRDPKNISFRFSSRNTRWYLWWWCDDDRDNDDVFLSVALGSSSIFLLTKRYQKKCTSSRKNIIRRVMYHPGRPKYDEDLTHVFRSKSVPSSWWQAMPCVTDEAVIVINKMVLHVAEEAESARGIVLISLAYSTNG